MVIIMLKRDPVDKLLAGNPLTIFTSYRNHSIYFSAHQPTGFYMMGILIANELIVAVTLKLLSFYLFYVHSQLMFAIMQSQLSPQSTSK